MLISPVLESPPVPFTVSVGRSDAGVADVEAVAVGAAVGQLPADRQAAAAAAEGELGQSSPQLPLPVMLRAPVGRDRRAVLQQKSPATLVRPVSALLLPSVPASATRAFAPSSRACHRSS